MREILFRGKRICDDEWIEGYFGRYHNGESDVACISIPSNGFFGLSSYEVDPETVGQYTGLNDKNGNKIFEGDLLIVPFDDKPLSIKFEDGIFIAERVGNQDWLFLWEAALGKVIGNIYDNPELIGGKK